MKERVLVFDRWLVVLGSGFRKGSEYYYGDLGVPGDQIPSCEVRDLTGDGQSEIILRKRFVSGSRTREVLQVMTFDSGEVPLPIFQHEVAVSTDAGSVADEVAFAADGAKTSIKITPGKAAGFNAGNYREPTETAYDPVLLPWGAIASQTYKFNGKAFTRTAEEKQAPTSAPAAAAVDAALPQSAAAPGARASCSRRSTTSTRKTAAPPAARASTSPPTSPATSRPSACCSTIATSWSSARASRAAPATRSSRSALRLALDILDITARDVTGDGKLDIVVKGVIHASAPKDAGGGTVDREVVMIYQMAGEALKRVFAAELGRAIGKKRIQGAIGFAGNGSEIELAAGKAVDWTEKTYPFNQDPSAVGGIEPLILPWSSARARFATGGRAAASATDFTREDRPPPPDGYDARPFL